MIPSREALADECVAALESSDRPTIVDGVRDIIAGLRRNAMAEGRIADFNTARRAFTPSQFITTLGRIADEDGDEFTARLFEGLARITTRYEVAWDELGAPKGGRR